MTNSRSRTFRVEQKIEPNQTAPMIGSPYVHDVHFVDLAAAERARIPFGVLKMRPHAGLALHFESPETTIDALDRAHRVVLLGDCFFQTAEGLTESGHRRLLGADWFVEQASQLVEEPVGLNWLLCRSHRFTAMVC